MPGWEFAIAKQAMALNPHLLLYGLQWGAPGWVGGTGPHGPTLFTSADITLPDRLAELRGAATG